MCIANNFQSRRAFGGPTAASAISQQQQQELLNRLSSIKSNTTAARASPNQSFDLSAFEPKPLLLQQVQSTSLAQQVKQQNQHIIVQHDYHDHAHDDRADYQEEHPARGGVTTPFPLKLHEMLERLDQDGYAHVVSWQPHGRCFVVHKPKEFVELLPTYFKLSKLASFQRQLNLYGFQRLTRGQDRGGYYHELFLKGRVFLAHSIQRIKVKGTGVRARSNPEQEPNFWAMPWVEGRSTTTSFAAAADSKPSAPVLEKPIAQLPLELSLPPPKSAQQGPEDYLCAFGEKTFHYLDPFQPVAPPAPQEIQPSTKWTVSGVDELLATEADAFFEDFDFPDDIGSEIENDDVFGHMLEQMIA